MEITRKKALYLFLSSLLGMILVLMFHRSVFLIYDMLGDFFPRQQLLNLPYYYVAVADFTTLLLAMFIGGWWGIWLGLNWYKMVYEDRHVRSWFHGFLPHAWRSHKVKDSSAQASATGMPRKITATSDSSDVFQTMRATGIKPVWSFEDFKNVESKTEPKKRAVKKRVVKKRVKKSTKSTEEPEVE